MKLSALLSRQKGRDFYDTLFLWKRTQPDFDFLMQRCGIGDMSALMTALRNMVEHTNLTLKQRDFEHLLFEPRKSECVLHFMEIISQGEIDNSFNLYAL